MQIRIGRHLRNSLLLTVGSGVAQLLSATTFLVLARSMGVGEFGDLVSTYGAALFMSVIFEFGTASLATRELAQEGHESFAVRYRARTTLMVLALAMVAVCFAFHLPYPQWQLAVALGLCVSYNRFSAAPVQSAMRLGRLSAATVAEKGLTLVSVFLLLRLSAVSSNGFLLVCVGASVVSTLITRLSWPKDIRRLVRSNARPRLTGAFVGGLHLGLSNLAIGVQSLDSLVIKVAAGSGAAGVYGAVGRWTQPLSLVASAVTQSSYSEMVHYTSHRRAGRMLRTSLGVIALAGSPLLLVVVFADQMVTFLLGETYAASANVLRILALAVFFGMANAPLSAFLQARGCERFTSATLLVAIPTQLLLCGLLAHFFGPGLAAIGVLVAQAGIALRFSGRVWTLLSESESVQAVR